MKKVYFYYNGCYDNNHCNKKKLMTILCGNKYYVVNKYICIIMHTSTYFIITLILYHF